MKKVFKDSIENIENTDLFDNKFLFSYFSNCEISNDVEIIDLGKLLKEKENTDLLNNMRDKYAMYSNVYSSQDELEIFKRLFDDAIKNNKKIHIIGVTLKEEIEILEEYYTSLGFLREDINCFLVDFSIPLITVSVNIENLIWKGSDYKAQRKNIFFIPPIRESGENKAMFKGINRGVIAGINIKNFDSKVGDFLSESIKGERLLLMTLSKVLYYNLKEIGFNGQEKEFIYEHKN